MAMLEGSRQLVQVRKWGVSRRRGQAFFMAMLQKSRELVHLRQVRYCVVVAHKLMRLVAPVLQTSATLMVDLEVPHNWGRAIPCFPVIASDN